MTPPLYYSCHQLLSLSPFLSLLFGPISFLRSPAVSKSSTLLFSLSHLSLSIFLNHLLPYCSLSTQIFHSTHPSTVSLTSYPSLSHFTPCFSPSFSILALGTVMVHSATVFISASSPEWLCLYLNIRNTFLLKRYTTKKKEKEKRGTFKDEQGCIHPVCLSFAFRQTACTFTKQYALWLLKRKTRGKHSFCADLLQTKSKKMYLFNQKFKMSVKN